MSLAIARPALSSYKSLDLDETEEEIKATPGEVGFIHVINRTNALQYLKFYNATAANVTVGTTVPIYTFPVPGNNDTDGAGFVIPLPDEGLLFSVAITMACTLLVADNDATDPGAAVCIVNVGYR